MINKELIGKRLTELRGDQSREKVAYSNGISVSALTLYETGRRVPRDEIKVSLARYYNTTVESIFFAQ